MKAMILAAGLGTRLHTLTARVPKPLLRVGGKPLIEYHIAALRRIGVLDIVINLHHRGDQIRLALGDGSLFGVKIHYSQENTLLDTGGGIRQALSLLGDEPFILVNGDIWTDYPFRKLDLESESGNLAHLVLADTPEDKIKGDFYLHQGRVCYELQERGDPWLTYCGIAMFHPQLFSDAPEGRFRLFDHVSSYIRAGQVSGEYYTGEWHDAGTCERLATIRGQVLSEGA